ncbi:hypothetical protein VE01_05622 [Pseudogymnoascus verrucosus]|uniref:Uncharacterized protein n=1 Tax=Pseudogymnoascus verrucosus TaxID=342668 RepID=A0A1B8GKU8_9PEZI|nr:uncharacterized protein VE01_05622 [Pseudogymnoascus verrucosus]OBT96457.1 hypothetical protein VE01_05622 [Pseudogymnoascus verrucosus]
MASPSPNLLPPPPSPSFPPFEDIVHSESALLKHVSRNYAHTSFETFTAEGYVDFAYTVENMRWAAFAQGDIEPLPRREMDRLWINIVMEFWVKMAWCWEGDVEGVVIALLDREDGKGVEEMWEDRKMDYPELNTRLCYPMIGHKGIFEDYLDLGIRAVINPEIRCYLEKMEDGTNYDSESELGEAVYSLDLDGFDPEDDAEGDTEVEEATGLEDDAGIDDAKIDDTEIDDGEINHAEINHADGGAEAEEATEIKENAQIDDAEIDDGTAFLEALDAAIEKATAEMEAEGMVFEESDEDENEIKIKEEDEGAETSIYGIPEAVSNLHLTESGNKDDVDKVVDDIKQEDIKQEKDVKQEKNIKQEKDIKKEEDGTGTITYPIRSAISNLRLTESVQNILANTQATIPAPEIGFTPPNPPSRLGNATLAPDAAIPTSHYAAGPPMDGPSSPGPSASRAANNLREAVGRLSAEEAGMIIVKAVMMQHPIKKELVDMLPFLANIPSSTVFRGENGFQKLLPNVAPEAMTSPRVQTTGLSGSYKIFHGVSHLIPRNEDPAPAPKDIICDTFDMAYEDACKTPGFWEHPMWNGVEVYKMSPLVLAQHYAAHKEAAAFHAKPFVFNPTRVFQAPIAANVPTPVFQAPTAATIPAPVFQAQTRCYNPANPFHARRAVHYPGLLFQAQTGTHYPAPSFHGANYPTPNTAPLSQADFYAANYPTPYGPLGFQVPPPVSRFATNPAPGFQAPPPVSRFASNPAPPFQAPPPVSRFSDPNHIHLNYLATPPAPPIFINLTAADFKDLYSPPPNLTAAYFEKMDKYGMHDYLPMPRKRQDPKMRQDPKIKIEEDEEEEDFKMANERCYSDSVLARKRARDVEEGDEEVGVERPRKFSG